MEFIKFRDDPVFDVLDLSKFFSGVLAFHGEKDPSWADVQACDPNEVCYRSERSRNNDGTIALGQLFNSRVSRG